MLPFQWNALKVGDEVIVHDDRDSLLTLREGVVSIVDSCRASANDVGVRLHGDDPAIIRPRRHAVHMVPLDRRFTCWRCDQIASSAAPVARAAWAAA
jgi:hypothetical protein